jgi:hypothetical protein
MAGNRAAPMSLLAHRIAGCDVRSRDLLIGQCDAFRGRVEKTPNFSCWRALYVASFGISVSQCRVLIRQNASPIA